MSAKLRIAVVSPFLDKRHGTERCVAEQLEQLARECGYEVHLYCQRVEDIGGLQRFVAGDDYASAPGKIFWHKVPEIPGPHLVKYAWWFLANQFGRWRDLRARGLRWDLVYSPGINCWDADAVAVHIVFHEFYALVRDELRLRRLPWRAWPRALHRRLYYRFIMALEKRLYRNPRVALAAVSGLTARELERHFGRADARVIPNAVNVEAFNPQVRLARRAEARNRLGFDDTDCVLLLVGNDWRKKGLDYLLGGVAQCRELPLKVLVVGRDDRAPYETAIGRLGLTGRVRFVEPSADVMQFYAASDVYAGPSRHDSFAFPPCEAMACGLPVVTSASNGGSEIIRHGVDGFVLPNPADSEKLAAILRQLCTDTDLRQRVGANAAETVRQYSWERNVAEARAWLEEVFRTRSAQLGRVVFAQ